MDMNLKTLKRLAKLFAMLGTANEHERSNVWDSINKILQQHLLGRGAQVAAQRRAG